MATSGSIHASFDSARREERGQRDVFCGSQGGGEI